MRFRRLFSLYVSDESIDDVVDLMLIGKWFKRCDAFLSIICDNLNG